MISLIIPIYNEEKLLDELAERSVSSLKSTGEDYEIIFVDDGSSDGSTAILFGLQKNNSSIKILRLSRNFGHQAAYTAGIDHASGDYIVLMDGDLQDPPELIPEMHKMLAGGDLDIVNGFRKPGPPGGSRRVFKKLFHRLFNNVSGLNNIQHVGNFSMLNRRATDALRQLKEKTRYIPGLRNFIGFRSGIIEYEREERKHGRSRMSTSSLFKLAFDAIFSFSKFPIKFSLILGMIGIVVSFLAGIYILLSKFLDLSPLGWSSTLISIFFLGSIQLVFLGILGEYVYRIYQESQNRPVYFVQGFYTGENKKTVDEPANS
jgi:polyisoprenyl-phosphate glycosyltransferase